MILIFKLIVTPPDRLPIFNQYIDPKKYKLTVDPMTVTEMVEAFDESGEVTTVEIVTQYSKADWEAEVIE